MVINKMAADKIWIAYFGESSSSYDAFGTLIYRNRHGHTGDGGWDVDHIFPQSKNGTTTFDNLQPLYFENNRIKSDNTKGIVNGIAFGILKENGIYRMYIVRNNIKYWSYKNPVY